MAEMDRERYRRAEGFGDPKDYGFNTLDDFFRLRGAPEEAGGREGSGGMSAFGKRVSLKAVLERRDMIKTRLEILGSFVPSNPEQAQAMASLAWEQADEYEELNEILVAVCDQIFIDADYFGLDLEDED